MPRRQRINRLAPHVSPGHLFVTGIIVIACFLLQQNLIVRIAQVAAFAVIASLSGKRIRYGYFAIMVTSITVFNLLTPLGEVILRAGPLVITRGALTQGLLKGFAIPGLVFISLFAVSTDLRLPGRFGGIVARLFYYFEQLLEGRRQVRLRGFVESIDSLLLGLLESSPATGDDSLPVGPVAPGNSRTTTSPSGYLFILILTGLCITAVVLFATF